MKIFKDLIVIELASVLAGPSVGQFFAELGAKVLKIENPNTKGDVTRSWKLPKEDKESSISAYFSSVNWGKESIVLDIKKANDKKYLYELIKNADIVVASYKPGDAEKLGVDHQTLKRINPKIIYGHITGYGNDSPRVGYDAIIQAESGFMYINGEPKGASVKMPVALVDVLAAHQLKEGILIALYKRLYSQEGSYVAVSLFDSAVSSLVNQASNWLNAGHIPQKIGSEHPNIVPYGTVFKTQDNSTIILAVGNDKQFHSLCEILKIPQISNDYLYASNQLRVINKDSLLKILSDKILMWNKDALLKELNTYKVPVGSINNMKEVFELENSKPLILKSNNVKGIRQFVAQFDNDSLSDSINPPPEFVE